jgi:hypothetical protein
MIHMPHIKHLTALALATLLASAANGEPLIVDSFESGDMSATNADGFDWGNNNRTSVVTADAVVYNNGEINVPIPSGRDWGPFDGEHSLRIRYARGEPMAEQRFDMGKGYPEIWMSFWLRVPVNFTHPSSTPNNQKLFRLYMDGYSQAGEGSTVGMSFRPNGEGGSNFFAKVSPGDLTIVGGDIDSVPFITVPDDRGRWMNLVVHVKSETQPGSQDGVMEVWRKWEGEQDYSKTHDLRNQPIKLDSTVGGFASGYLMGWANAPYSQDTEFLIDQFILSKDSLLSQTNQPSPPSDLKIN